MIRKLALMIFMIGSSNSRDWDTKKVFFFFLALMKRWLSLPAFKGRVQTPEKSCWLDQLQTATKLNLGEVVSLQSEESVTHNQTFFIWQVELLRINHFNHLKTAFLDWGTYSWWVEGCFLTKFIQSTPCHLIFLEAGITGMLKNWV